MLKEKLRKIKEYAQAHPVPTAYLFGVGVGVVLTAMHHKANAPSSDAIYELNVTASQAHGLLEGAIVTYDIPGLPLALFHPPAMEKTT